MFAVLTAKRAKLSFTALRQKSEIGIYFEAKAFYMYLTRVMTKFRSRFFISLSATLVSRAVGLSVFAQNHLG